MENEKQARDELMFLTEALYDRLAENTNYFQFNLGLVEDLCVDRQAGKIEFTMKKNFGGKSYVLQLKEIKRED